MSSNIFIDTVSRFRSNTTVQELVVDFKSQIKLKIFKRTKLQPQTLIKKFSAIQRMYAKDKKPQLREAWQQNERKIFIWFILAFSKLHFKKLSEITDKQWAQISACFGHKNVLLMKYESRCLERNPERVRWTSEEELILKSCIQGELSGKWSEISKVLFFKTGADHFKTAKQCRQHWFNHLNDSIKRGQWTVLEDLTILKFVLKEGHHWSRIVSILAHNRTEHMIKNRFGSLLTCGKKLLPDQQRHFSESQLIKLLINELDSNGQKLMAEGQDLSGASEKNGAQLFASKIKQEQKQYKFQCQQTVKQINHKKQSEVKISEDRGQLMRERSVPQISSSGLIQEQKNDKNLTNSNARSSYFYNHIPSMPPSDGPYYIPSYYPSPINGAPPANPFLQFLTGLECQQECPPFFSHLTYPNYLSLPTSPGTPFPVSNFSQGQTILKEEG